MPMAVPAGQEFNIFESSLIENFEDQYLGAIEDSTQGLSVALAPDSDDAATHVEEAIVAEPVEGVGTAGSLAAQILGDSDDTEDTGGTTGTGGVGGGTPRFVREYFDIEYDDRDIDTAGAESDGTGPGFGGSGGSGDDGIDGSY